MTDDLKQRARQRVKTALMGGSILDSFIRLFLVVLTIIFFVYLLIAHNLDLDPPNEVCFTVPNSNLSTLEGGKDIGL